MNTFKQSKSGFYSYVFYKEDIVGKIDAIDLLEEIKEKRKGSIEELSNNISKEYIVCLTNKIEYNNTMIRHLENIINNGYNKFGITPYKGYTL